MIGMLLSALAAIQAPVPQQPAVPVLVPPAASAAQAPIDPARLAAAEKLLLTMHCDDQYESIFSRLIPVITVQLMSGLGSNAKLSPTLRSYFTEPTTRDKASRVFAEEAMKGFRAHYADLRKATAREYALVFTADELNQLTTFYSSPVGEKALAMLPQLQSKLMPLGMSVGQDVGKQAMLRTFERLGLADKKISS